MHQSAGGAKGKRADQTTLWSDWEFSAQDGRDRSYRLDSHGRYEFRYRPAQTYGSSNAATSSPTFLPGSTTPYMPRVAGDNTFRETQSWGNGNPTVSSQSPPYNAQGYAPVPRYSASSNSAYPPTRSTYSSVDGMTTQLANTRLSSNSPANVVTAANTATRGKELDPRFKVHNSKYFIRGVVFTVVWSEPAGSSSSDVESDSISVVRFGERIHSKVRRFVVVKSFQGHSICLPLLTYQSQGTRKLGVDPRSHAAICPVDGKPRFAPGEEAQLGEAPFHFVPNAPRDKLDPMTRLNFSKPYTVEHNVKIMIIGKIVDDDLSRLHRFYIGCQTDDEDAQSYGNSNEDNNYAPRPQTTESYISSAPSTTSASYGGRYTFDPMSQGGSSSVGMGYPPTAGADRPSYSDRSFPSQSEVLSVGGYIPESNVSASQSYVPDMSYSGSASSYTPSPSYTTGSSTSQPVSNYRSAYSGEDTADEGYVSQAYQPSHSSYQRDSDDLYR